ncbi:MAG: T9SS type A sorting domain-containing protein, partial [Nonlabens sp.]|nr:T9SS type A sorting domain-containing protein [Nonlabens sp.]
NPSYWTFTPSSVVIDFPAQPSPAIEDFCVMPNGVHEDLEIVVIPLQLARPGFDVNYKAIIKNKGNQVSSGTVTLDFPAEYMSVASTTPAAVTAPATRLTWNYTNIAPFNSEEFLFTMSMNTPTAAPIPLLGGEVLFFTGTVNVTGTDVLPLDNVMTLKQRVVNSYDPNDKTCLEGETIEPSMVGDYVHYLIRFENMGTASAVNVVITDQINSNQFDITTLLPLDASHSYYTNFNENNEVEFIFEDINLDFNDATNDGYILFKIKTLSTLNVGDTFDNTAQIFFDYNAPIVTNTETVTVQSTASVNDTTDATISVYPNPAREFIQVQSSSSLRSIQVTNMNGSVLNQTQLTGNISSERVSLSGLASGIYFVVVQSDKGKKVEKLIVY